MKQALRIPITMLVLTIALLIAGCGGDDAADEDPQALLERTFGSDLTVDSAVLDISFNLEAAGPEPISVDASLSGPFESAGENLLPKLGLDLSIDAQGAGQDFKFDGGLTVTDEQAFVISDGTAYEVDNATFSTFEQIYSQSAATQQAESEQGSALFQQLGISPETWLTDVTNEGTEEIDGVETVHISGDADLRKIIEDAQTIASSTGQAGQVDTSDLELLEESVKDVSIDVFTGAEDNILRRLTLSLTYEQPDADDGGPESADLSLSIGLSKVNEEQEFEIPSDARPLGELIEGFGGIAGLGDALGGVGGGTGGAPGGAGGAGGGSAGGAGAGGGSGLGSGTNDAYLDCVANAPSPEEITECAELLS